MSGLVQNTGSFTPHAEWELSLRTRAETGLITATAPAQEVNPCPRPGYSGVDEPVSRFHSFLEYSMLALLPVVFISNVYLSLSRLYEQELIWLAVLAIPISLVGGDFITGVVHWGADTYFSEDTPIIGPGFVKPFRLHHIYPRDITTHHIAATVGNSCVIAVPVLSVCLYLIWSWEVSSWLAFSILCVALMGLSTVATNQFHKWAHQEIPPAYAQSLQRMRLVLEPAHHELHHTEPFESHYCITNGWLNPLLNKIKFFRRIESALAFIGIHTAKVNELNEHNATPKLVSEAGRRL